VFRDECMRIAAGAEAQHGLHPVQKCREPHHNGDDAEDDLVSGYGTTLVSFTTGRTMCDAACGVRYTLIVAVL